MMVSHTTGASARHQNNDRDKPDLMAIHREAGGVLALNIIRPGDALNLVAASLEGGSEASRLLRAVCDTVARIESAPRRKPMLCGNCPRPLRGSGFVICVAVPDRDSPTNGLAFALCEYCSRDDAALVEKASSALRTVWPDLRAVEITHPKGGRA
jgi:hypothetical protein